MSKTLSHRHSAHPPSATSDVPAEPAEPRIVDVTADFFEGHFPFKAFQRAQRDARIHALDPLVLEVGREQFVIVTKFGAVVYWDCPEDLIRATRDDVARLAPELRRQENLEDALNVQLGAEEEAVQFERIALRDAQLDRVKIVARALAQSVALEYYEQEVGRAVERLTPLVDEMAATGRMVLAEKEVLRAVGFAMAVRGAALQNLTLFDDPPETWEDEQLARLDHRLYDYFDIEDRFDVLHQKVGYLAGVNNAMMEVLHVRKGHRLEWIIIILIAIELIFFVLTELR